MPPKDQPPEASLEQLETQLVTSSNKAEPVGITECKIDLATPKNPQAHINVNRAVTGLKDPHIGISSTTAQNAAKAGTFLNYLNKAAPILTAVAVAYDGYQIAKNVKVDRQNGSTRNTTKKVVTTAATWGGGFGGSATGATIGTAMFPGIGTMIGAIVGGIAGGIGGSVGSDIASEAAMDALKYDISYPKCVICLETFECRNFETGQQIICEQCEESNQKASNSLANQKTCKMCGTNSTDESDLCETCGRCDWCGSDEQNLEKVELENGQQKLCKTCIVVLNREINQVLNESVCEICGVILEEDTEEDNPNCKSCSENLANEILEQKEALICKWCQNEFEDEKGDQLDFCPECDAKRPKKNN
ncbi:hypothetical protein B9Z55_011827 [Caenorhabditis nigoni]|uniref:Uncharacterized protein n=1 Tax=Caenorhabditis nigoni TaxID=1611254 RepID=A0A2G5ULR5_9PELO|nr:hypothetical protein B9Z55_011827 [Caenorhabditis nigoni]